MSGLFKGCSSLKGIDVSPLDTANVEDMSEMFHNCSSLTELDLSSFVTDKNRYLYWMFDNCSSLIRLDISSFSTANLAEYWDTETAMFYMFWGCKSLSSLKLGPMFMKWESDAYLPEATWHNAEKNLTKTSLELQQNYPANAEAWSGTWEKQPIPYAVLKDNGDLVFVTSMNSIDNNSNTTVVDINGISHTGVVFADFIGKTYTSSSLAPWHARKDDIKNIYVADNTTVELTSLAYWFADLPLVESIRLAGFDGSKVTDMKALFWQDYSLYTVDFNGFNSANVTNMWMMFGSCYAIEEVDLSPLNTASVTNMAQLFAATQSIKKLDFSNLDTQSMTSMSLIFPSTLREVKLGTKFLNWLGNNLPEGNWVNYEKNLTLNSEELSEGYAANVNDWAGTWVKGKIVASIPEEEMNTSGIPLMWTDINAEKYEVYRNGQYLTTLTTTSYDDNVGRTMGTEYTYKVRGYLGGEGTGQLRGNESGEWSEFSDEITVIYNPFIDVPTDSDSFIHVAWAYNHNIVNGVSGVNNLFNLYGNCLRRNFCFMLWNMMGKPNPGKTTPFKDLTGLSSNNVKGITWCYNQKIVNGTSSTTFNPNGDISRRNLAIMLWKLAGQPSTSGMTCPYTDLGSLTANNKKAVIWCYNKGLINSITGTLFEPNASGTRALLAEMLYGYNQIYHVTKD
jgi:surface protein